MKVDLEISILLQFLEHSKYYPLTFEGRSPYGAN